MKRLVLVSALFLCFTTRTNAEGIFLNLNFEETTVLTSTPTGMGFETGVAVVPHWRVYGGWSSNYSGGTTLPFNDQPVNEPGVTLARADLWRGWFEGDYAVLLQGGILSDTNGASIGQTGEIPLTAHSMLFVGDTWTQLKITFNNQLLYPTVVASYERSSLYGVNISPYAGQTGELLVTALWESGGFIDDIQFSPNEVPEPKSIWLIGVGILLLSSRCVRHDPQGRV